MHSRKKANLASASAIVFLLIAATAAGFVIARLSVSLHWIAHTYDVQVALGDISSTFTVAGRARTTYELDADEPALNAFNTAVATIPGKFARLKQLLADNPDQVDTLNRLQDLENQRRGVLQAAVDQRRLGPRSDEDQKETTRQVVTLGT